MEGGREGGMETTLPTREVVHVNTGACVTVKYSTNL